MRSRGDASEQDEAEGVNIATPISFLSDMVLLNGDRGTAGFLL